MSTLEEQLKREIEEHGESSPIAQILRNQLRAQNEGLSLQSLYLKKESESDNNKPNIEAEMKGKGSFLWLGWQASADDAPQPVSILYGRNLKKNS
jgi:hypothetical protein